MANWTFNFIVSLTFLLLIDALGPQRRFFFYAGDLRAHVLLLQGAGPGDQGQAPRGHHECRSSRRRARRAPAADDVIA